MCFLEKAEGGVFAVFDGDFDGALGGVEELIYWLKPGKQHREEEDRRLRDEMGGSLENRSGVSPDAAQQQGVTGGGKGDRP